MRYEDKRHMQLVEQFRETGRPRDWTEDFAHDNGMYMNTCCNCGETFTGHKRRYTCKLCVAAEIVNTVEIIDTEKNLIAELYWYQSQGLTKQVRHKKTGTIYYVIGEPRIHCTNGFEDQMMIQYALPSMAKIFVREQNEFWEKFEAL